MMSRIQAVDLARGVALLGMMMAHLGPSRTGAGPAVHEIISSGRAAPLFAVLAGVSLTLVHRRDPAGVGSTRSTVLRGLLLIVLGLSLGSLRDMPVLVIFAFYGLLVVAALPFRALPSRALVVITIGWSVAGSVGLLALRIHHAPVLVEQPSFSDVTDPWRLITTVLVWGGYPAVVWISYVLAGLAIGRLDLADRVVAARLAAGGLLVAAGSLAVARTQVTGWRLLFEHDVYPFEPVGWHEVWAAGPHSSMPLNVIGAMGSAGLVIGLCSLIVSLDTGRRVTAPLAAAGAMTLTLYTVHVLWTWRWWLDVELAEGSWQLWWVQVVVLVAAAAVWRRRFSRGPLEHLMRLLTVRNSRDLVAPAPR